MSNAFTSLLCLMLVYCLAPVHTATGLAESSWENEVIYHVFQRSFYDADGDGHGDLDGFTAKLPYLKELGVTAILFVPLYQSELYHNYFPTDYEKIDPEFGSMQDYREFIAAVHREGMKFIMDMETQYAMQGHAWMEAINHPGHRFSDFIYFHDRQNRVPERFSFKPQPARPVTADDPAKLVNLNLRNDAVKRYMMDLYAHWIDPDGDGRFDDGVDGYRLDHVMDDLDNKGILTDLYAEFWRPIVQHCRSINPDLFIVAEQADWTDFGEELIEQCDVSAVFGFPTWYAIASLDATKITKAVETTRARLPEGKHVVNFIENHDIGRFAEFVKDDSAKLRAAAVLNMTLPGIPAIYFGQELGLTGDSTRGHLRVRQAFPWTTELDDEGMADWFRNHPEARSWWSESIYETGEARRKALSVQRQDPGSLWNHYRSLIALRKTRKEFRGGDYQNIALTEPGIICFSRSLGNQRSTVIVNLTEQRQTVPLDKVTSRPRRVIFGTQADGETLSLEPWGFSVLGSSSTTSPNQ